MTSGGRLACTQAATELLSQPLVVQGAQGGELGQQGGPFEMGWEVLSSQQSMDSQVPILLQGRTCQYRQLVIDRLDCRGPEEMCELHYACDLVRAYLGKHPFFKQNLSTQLRLLSAMLNLKA